MVRIGHILTLLIMLASLEAAASQDVVVTWNQVRFIGALNLAGYATIAIDARTVERSDVTYFETLRVSVDGSKISFPTAAFADLPYPTLGGLEITYPFSEQADAEALIYLSIPYVLPDPYSAEFVKARFTIDLKRRRVVERTVTFPDPAGVLQTRSEKVPW